MSERVLIVDDDKDIAQVIKDYLEGHGLEAVIASNGADAIGLVAKKRPDIILTDVDMPRMDGLTFCKKIRSSDLLSQIPLIIMSGNKVSEKDMVSGYGFGADDYISKPFSYPLLLAKIKALLRITGATDKVEYLSYRNLSLDLKGRTATLDGKAIRLTAKEFDLLSALVSNKGNVLSSKMLLESVWGYNTEDYSNVHTVEVHISNLRKKLGSFSKNIIAVPGFGYKIGKV